MCSSRWRRHVVSEGPLKGPDGTSVVMVLMDAAIDGDESVLSSGGAAGAAILRPQAVVIEVWVVEV